MNTVLMLCCVLLLSFLYYSGQRHSAAKYKGSSKASIILSKINGLKKKENQHEKQQLFLRHLPKSEQSDRIATRFVKKKTAGMFLEVYEVKSAAITASHTPC